MLQRFARHHEVAEDVGAEGPLDLGGRDLGEVLDLMLLGRVVHEDVEAAEFRDRALDRAAAEAFVADVARQREALPALGLDQADGFLRVLMLVEIDNQDAGALACEGH